MALADLLEADVVYVKKRWQNVRGNRTLTSEDRYDLRASVQEMGADRVSRFDIPGGEAAFTCYFDAADFKAGPARASTQDVILWQGRTLAVLARERDEGGAGRVYSVDCSEFS